MPVSWALTRILTNSRIFTCSAHMVIFFTYSETLSSPLSSYVQFILLCRLPPMSARLVCSIVDAGAYELIASVFPPTTTTQQQHLATPRKRFFFDLWQLCSLVNTACCLGRLFFNFFSWFDELAKTRQASAIPTN